MPFFSPGLGDLVVQETAKYVDFSFFNNFLVIVVFPAPEGEDIITVKSCLPNKFQTFKKLLRVTLDKFYCISYS